MTVKECLEIACKHANATLSGSSARFCMHDSLVMYNCGNDWAAMQWAVKSLAHSVGVFHSDYKAIKQQFEAMN